MKIAITGQQHFIKRYRKLLEGLALEGHHELVFLDVGNILAIQPYRTINWVKDRLRKWGLSSLLSSRPKPKSAQHIRAMSLDCERKIKAANPDLVFHFFGSLFPFAGKPSVPYIMYLDFTQRNADMEYPPWAACASAKDREQFLEMETVALQQASAILAMGRNCSTVLEQEYGVDPKRIRVVGNPGTCLPDPGYVPDWSDVTKKQTILFNGSEFHRKGGDIALAAFADVRRLYPELELQVVGLEDGPKQKNVTYLGGVSFEHMKSLFQSSRMAIAPAICDPFPSFVIEAMRFGIPTVVSSISGMVGDAENEGAFLIADDATELAAQMIRILESETLSKSLSEIAMRRVQDAYTTERFSAAILSQINLHK